MKPEVHVLVGFTDSGFGIAIGLGTKSTYVGGAPTVGRAQSHSTMASSSSASASAAGQELEEFLKVLDKEPSTVSALAGTFSPTCAHPHP